MDHVACVHWKLGYFATIKESNLGKKRRLDDLKSHWKGVVRASKQSQRGEKVEKVLIAHVYEHKDILKESVAKQENFPQIGLNCKGSSFYKH